VAERSVARSNFLAALLSMLGIVLVVVGIVLGALAVRAVQARREAGRRAAREAGRAQSLEHAVAERTRELSRANERLRDEAATRVKAEAQLRQSQKMEAVGQLTGGIAHDFNNMLAVVIGGLDLARRRTTAEMSELARHLDNALDGANRAAALTKRLLAFARAGSLQPEGVDTGRLIAGMSDLIDRTLGERIDVTTDLAADGWPVWCDPNQLENAILNLAVNARDAMPQGGRLTIATANVVLDENEVGAAKAGEYVRIDVRDSGVGMSQDVLERVFEPFFTTKPVARGPGSASARSSASHANPTATSASSRLRDQGLASRSCCPSQGRSGGDRGPATEAVREMPTGQGRNGAGGRG
jgi:signal transduction histidine kinase